MNMVEKEQEQLMKKIKKNVKVINELRELNDNLMEDIQIMNETGKSLWEIRRQKV